MPVIYLVRHAQASFGQHDYDVLSERGQEQARLLDAALAARGVRPSQVVAGSLRRQIDTARACGATTSLAPAIDSRWNEYDSADVLAHYGAPAPSELPRDGLGAPRGLSSRQFQELLDPALQAWIEAGEQSRCAESSPAFRRRVLAAANDLAHMLGKGETGVAFTSAGVIAALAAALLEVPPVAFVGFNRVMVNASVSKVLVGRSGLQLFSFNEHAHVEGDRGLMTFR